MWKARLRRPSHNESGRTAPSACARPITHLTHPLVAATCSHPTSDAVQVGSHTSWSGYAAGLLLGLPIARVNAQPPLFDAQRTHGRSSLVVPDCHKGVSYATTAHPAIMRELGFISAYFGSQHRPALLPCGRALPQPKSCTEERLGSAFNGKRTGKFRAVCPNRHCLPETVFLYRIVFAQFRALSIVQHHFHFLTES